MKVGLALALGAGALLASGVSALPVPAAPYTPPDYKALCPATLHTLDLAIQVIGATPNQIASAKSAYNSAESAMKGNDFYSCTQSARSGLKALDAG